MRTVWCLVVAILLFDGVARVSRAQTNQPPYVLGETNYGVSPLVISNLVVTNTLKFTTNVPLFFSTNVTITNIIIPVTTNYGPWGPGGPPAPPKKPWYRRFWDWLKNLL